MNVVVASLLTWACGAGPPASVTEQYEDHAYTYTGGEYRDEVFRYRLLKPERIEPGTRYPVLLFLHGAGERGTDNKLQLMYLPELMATPENRLRFPCFLIAPQCRPERMWVDVSRDADRSEQPDQPDNPCDQLNVAIRILDEVLAKYPADPRRVYLTGLSMGGYGSWDAAAAAQPSWASARRAAFCCGSSAWPSAIAW